MKLKMSNLPLPHGGRLIDRRLGKNECRKAARLISGAQVFELSDNLLMDVAKISDGSFSPLEGFMDREDYGLVVKQKKLKNGLVWTIPIVFDISRKAALAVKTGDTIALTRGAHPIAILVVRDKFIPDRRKDAKLIFGTTDERHPGVREYLNKKDVFLGGDISTLNQPRFGFFAFDYEPRQTRDIFTQMGWRTVVAFHSRNVIHRAHEFLQKSAMQVSDGIFIHLIAGKTKTGDFLPDIILGGYQRFIKLYYPKQRALLGVLTCAMKFAGPREAVFHAIIRKNYGCTHFIVGRDHAGVGGFYQKYAAHNIFDEFGDLGITILKLSGPYFCKKCREIVTEKVCPHPTRYHSAVSGTLIRDLIKRGKTPPPDLMRPEVAKFLLRKARIKNIFSA